MALKVGPYILKEVLGSGSFADVRLGIHEKTGEKYAVKVFDKRKISCDDFETEVRREVKIMQYLRHPCIVSVHQVLMTGNNMYVVMELVTGGELYYEIVKHRRIPEPTSRKYFQMLVDAMNYCHKKGVYHRDLKPENLLLDGNGGIKITDFGMSWMKDHSDQTHELLHTQCGTPKYMAPEVITKARYGYKGDKIDVWDCGMILFALMAGYLPFNGEDDRAVFRQIVFGRVKFPAWFSDGACDVLMHMLEKDPERRWSLEQVRQHPWFVIDYEGDPLEKVKKEKEATKEEGGRPVRSKSREHEGVARKDYAAAEGGVGKERGTSRSRSRARGDEGGGRARSRSAVGRGSAARSRSRARTGTNGRRSDSSEGGSRRAALPPTAPSSGLNPASKLADEFLNAASQMEATNPPPETVAGENKDAPARPPRPPSISTPPTSVVKKQLSSDSELDRDDATSSSNVGAIPPAAAPVAAGSTASVSASAPVPIAAPLPLPSAVPPAQMANGEVGVLSPMTVPPPLPPMVLSPIPGMTPVAVPAAARTSTDSRVSEHEEEVRVTVDPKPEIPASTTPESPRRARVRPTPVHLDSEKPEAISTAAGDSKLSGRLVALLSPRSQKQAEERERKIATAAAASLSPSKDFTASSSSIHQQPSTASTTANPANKDTTGLGRLMNILSPRSAARASAFDLKSEKGLHESDVTASDASSGVLKSARAENADIYFDAPSDQASIRTDNADMDDLPKNFKGLKLSTTSKGVKRLVHKWKTTGAA